MFTNSKNLKIAKVATLIITVAIVSCNKGGGSAGGSNQNISSLAAAGLTPNFRLSLTDAPNGSFRSIKVNIEGVDLVLTNGKKSAFVPLEQAAGIVDLLSLQYGVTMSIGDLQIPKGVKITQIQFRLKKHGHEGVRLNGSKCQLPVSCGGTNDVYALTLDNPIEFDDEHHSNLVIDFDAHQSITDDDGKGERCGFAPAITVKSAGKWKPNKHDDDDFDTKGQGLNNHEAVHDQKKKFGKKKGYNKIHTGDDDDRDQVDSGNQCVTIQEPAVTPSPVPSPSVPVADPVVAPAPTPTPVVDPVAAPAPVVDPTVTPAVEPTPVVVPTAVPNFFGAQ